jgi:hypothetical protein
VEYWNVVFDEEVTLFLLVLASNSTGIANRTTLRLSTGKPLSHFALRAGGQNPWPRPFIHRFRFTMSKFENAADNTLNLLSRARAGHYSSIPLFQHSNCERPVLRSSYATEGGSELTCDLTS